MSKVMYLKPKTEDKGRVSQPVLKPVNPLWNKNVTPSPVIPRLNTPTIAPVVPRLQLPQATTNRIQTMKESALEPQYAPKRLTLPTSDKLGFTGQRVTIPEIKKPLNYVSPLSDREKQIAIGMVKPTEEERQALQVKMSSTPESVLAQNLFKGASFGLTDLSKSKEIKQAEAEASTKNPTQAIGGQIAGSLLPQAMLYKVVNKAIQGTNIGKKLLESSNVGTKFLASQTAQNLADVIIQSPIEIFNNIQNDKSYYQATKDYVIGRGIDAVLNAILGGVELTQGMKQALMTPQGVKKLADVGETVETIEQAVKSNDTGLIDMVRNKLNITPVEGETIVKQGLEQPTMLQKLRQASGVSPFGDATPQVQRQPITPQQTITPTLKPVDVPVAEATKPITSPLAPVKKYADDVQSKLNEADARYNERKAIINKSPADKEMKAKQLKQIGMERAAEKRLIVQGDSFEAVEGGLTAKELKNKIDKEATNYQGKKVVTPEGNGTLTGKNPFGKVGVTLDNGEVKFFDSAQIKAVDKPVVPKPIQEQPKQVVQPVLKPLEQPIVKPVEQTAPVSKQVVPPTPEVTVKPNKFVGTAKKSEATTDEVRARIKDIETASTTDKARLESAKKFVEDDLEGSLKVVRDGDKFESDMEGAIGFELYGKLQKAGRYDDAAEVVEALARKGKKSGQQIQILSLFSKTTPEGMVRWATKTLKDADMDVDQTLIKEVYNDMKSINEMTPEELSKLITSKIKNKKERQAIEGFIASQDPDVAKQYAVAQTMSKVFNRLPISSARKISTIQAMSHLLNAKTFIRNITGNVSSIGFEQIAKLPASVVDRALSVITGKRSLVANAPRWKQSFSEAIREGKRSYSEIRLGVNRANSGKYDMFYESAFAGEGKLNALGRKGEQLLSISLQTPDEAFKGFVKADSVYNQVRSRLGKEVDSWDFNKILDNATTKEIETAVDEANFATFQNDSLPAKILTDLKTGLNKAFGYGKTLPNGMKEFGVGDLVIKYTRVPGNILARVVEYSPLGALKALKLMGDLSTNQRQVSQVLGRAMTGSALMYLGKVLSENGLLTVEKGQTTDERSLEKAEGLGGTKINVDGLGRLITGGSPKKKSGDKFVSFDWIQPVATPLAIGSKLQETKGDGMTFDDLSNLVSATTFDQAIDLPTMFIAKRIMQESQRVGSLPEDERGKAVVDIVTIPLQEALPGFVWSGARQTAQMIDPIVRETKGATVGETTLNKIKANIPFLSKTLEPQISSLGHVKTREKGIFPNLINPATVTKYTPTGLSERLTEIKKLTGSGATYPNTYPPKNIEFYEMGVTDKQKTPLSAKEKTTYQKIYGQYVKDKYEQAFSMTSGDLTKSSAEELAKKLSKIESEARKEAVSAILRERGVVIGKR